jgi:hypothetical protein
MINNISQLMRAASTLLWPIIVLIVLLFYKTEIANLAARLRKAKLFGQEVELDKDLDNLERSAKQLEESTYAGHVSPESGPKLDGAFNDAVADAERDLLEETARSPKVGLMLLSREIEREARNLVASLGASTYNERRRNGTLVQNLTTLTEMGVLPKGIFKGLDQFRMVRNELIHGGPQASDDDILRAIDSGLAILRVLKAVPRSKLIVCDAGFKLYSDSECKTPIDGVLGILLEDIGPGGITSKKWVVPRRDGDLHPGDLVTFETNPEYSWDSSWYRDRTGKAELGWTGWAAEFTGKKID